ncbi:DNA-binding CsgD family transcriptional regulator [Cryobacterium mesophilum]|uniref:Uncharacterized protein n=1 Tax=Terrimesophilobacter mesophilus TaxID=433647 RepID=A0A4R8V8E8_9MICO|nr:AAA family ATPase [Terrimesophilobacter mesophilus]MBB5632247.1 DNA-binding CsgD family transcriptional regulator [Terrimesophilobacter mesophilus]TFB79099.1 hypothetical protein E3N84_02920 [Terrimesophilobacter mesophilus]
MAVVERESERSTLRRVLSTVGEPGAQAISVVGIPGIGKSTLVGLAVAECTDWLVLTARGTPLGAQVPHGVLVQLFAGLARSTAAGEPPFDGPGGMIRELMVDGAVGADMAALSYALHWIVSRLAEDRRVLVVVDDLHWADPASLSILGHAMGLLGSVGVGFLFGVRRGHPDDVGQELTAIVRGSTIVAPGPLTLAGTTAIVEGTGLDAEQVHELSGGVPFYVTELVAMGAAGRQLTSSAQVIESIGGRLAQHGGVHRDVARAAAILGTEATGATVAELAGVSESSLDPIVATLADDGILSASGRLIPAHPLVGEAIRNEMGESARAAFHDRAARILHARGASGSSVSAHILRSPVGVDAWRVTVLMGAGRVAIAAGAPGDAVAYLDRALLEMRADDPLRLTLLTEAAHASLAANDPAAAVSHLRNALALSDDVDARSRVLADLGDALFDAGDHAGAEAAYLQGAEELTAAGTDTTRPIFREFVARGLSAHLSFVLGPPVMSSEVIQQTIDQPQERDTPQDARLLAAAAVGFTLSGEPNERTRSLALRAYRRWPRSRSDFADDPTTYLLSGALTTSGLFAEGIELLTSAAHSARMRGRLLSEATARYCRGSVYFSQGDFRRAIPDLVAAVNSVPLGWARYRESAETLLIRWHIAVGDNAAAARIALTEQYESVSAAFQSIQYIGRSDYWTGVGRPSKGLGLAYDARDLLPSGAESFEFGWRGSAGDALFALGDVAAASRLAKEEVALAETSGKHATALGPALYRLARALGDDAEAIGLARRALEVLGPSRRYARAHVHELLAGRLVSSGDAAGAVELLLHALEYVQSQRLARAEKRILASLTAIGHPMIPSSLDRRIASLTPSEFRVATLASQGMSNREIAASLFVTLKTVEFHLSRCYRKLGIPARRDLAGILRAS